MTANTVVATRPGAASGRMIRRKAWPLVHPSDQRGLLQGRPGTAAMKPRSIHTVNGSTNER